jgi:MerR family transcriptional regulator, redox-sensitive transcriptional activator SoxR
VLLIGEVAERTGVATSAIRYYEEVGLVQSLRREAERRVFADQAVNRLRAIVGAREAGFSVEEIRRLLDSRADGTDGWSALVEEKIISVEERVDRLQAIARTLRESLDCGCRAWDECSIVMRRGGGDSPTRSQVE